ncbi:tyrosine-type recombinase/integrase [Yoonia sp. MH D7]
MPTTRIRDLRHTHASMAVSGGMPIQMAGPLLGHTQLQTAMRYAHLDNGPVLEAAQQNAAQLSGLISPAKAGSGACLRVVC